MELVQCLACAGEDSAHSLGQHKEDLKTLPSWRVCVVHVCGCSAENQEEGGGVTLQPRLNPPSSSSFSDFRGLLLVPWPDGLLSPACLCTGCSICLAHPSATPTPPLVFILWIPSECPFLREDSRDPQDGVWSPVLCPTILGTLCFHSTGHICDL